MSGHWTFVVLSYGTAFVVVGVIAARIILEHRRLKAELARVGRGTTQRAARERNPPKTNPRRCAFSPLRSSPLWPRCSSCALRRRRLAPAFGADRQAGPQFVLPAVEGLENVPGLSTEDLRQGHVSLVNVFASWCGPCHAEHPVLMALAKDPRLTSRGVAVYGLAYKDEPANARRFLLGEGNPFARIGADFSGRAAIDFRRLWRAGDLRHPRRRNHRPQIRRPADAERDRDRAAAADRQGGKVAGSAWTARLQTRETRRARLERRGPLSPASFPRRADVIKPETPAPKPQGSA